METFEYWLDPKDSYPWGPGYFNTVMKRVEVTRNVHNILQLWKRAHPHVAVYWAHRIDDPTGAMAYLRH